jgi:tetratricopeptide (TPR) repeat protein
MSSYRKAQLRHAMYYASVLENATALYLQGDEFTRRGLITFDLDRDNIYIGYIWSGNNTSIDEAAAQLCVEYVKAGKYLLSLRLHPRERLHWLQLSLLAVRRLKQELDEGIILGRIGLTYFDLGEWQKAIEFHSQHLAIGREIRDKRSEGVALGNLAIAHMKLGETNKAIEMLEQNLAVARELGDRRGEGISLGNLGIAYLNLSDYHSAIKYLLQSHSIAEELGTIEGEGRALNHLGIAYRKIGEIKKAIDYYNRYLLISRELNDSLGEATALFNKSFALEEMNLRDEAVMHAEAALKIYERIDSPYAQEARAKLAEWRSHMN